MKNRQPVAPFAPNEIRSFIAPLTLASLFVLAYLVFDIFTTQPIYKLYLIVYSLTASVDIVIDALEKALLDPLPEARLAAIWPLAWIRDPRTPPILKRAYETEPAREIKAQIVKIAYNLMSEVRDEILQDAANSTDEMLTESVEQIRVMRGG